MIQMPSLVLHVNAYPLLQEPNVELENIVDTLGLKFIGQRFLLLFDFFLKKNLDDVTSLGHDHQLFAGDLE